MPTAAQHAPHHRPPVQTPPASCTLRWASAPALRPMPASRPTPSCCPCWPASAPRGPSRWGQAWHGMAQHGTAWCSTAEHSNGGARLHLARLGHAVPPGPAWQQPGLPPAAYALPAGTRPTRPGGLPCPSTADESTTPQRRPVPGCAAHRRCCGATPATAPPAPSLRAPPTCLTCWARGTSARWSWPRCGCST